MIVTCKKCNISYQLKKRLIKESGTKVRCMKCSSIFRVFPPAKEKSNVNNSSISERKDINAYVRNAGLSVRATNVLLSNFKNIDEFLGLEDERIFELRNCGKKTFSELLKFKSQLMEKLGYELPKDNQETKTEPLIIPDWIKEDNNFYLAIKQQLSVRARNIIEKEAIDSVEKFMALESDTLLKLKNCGKKTIAEIINYQKKIAVIIGKGKDKKNSGISKNNSLTTFDVSYYSVEKWVPIVCKNSSKKKKIFMLRMGMLSESPMTLEQIGAKFDITRERVRQIILDIEKSARHHIHQQRIKPLIDYILKLVTAAGGKMTDSTLLYNLFEKQTNNNSMRFATPFIELLSTMVIWKAAGLNLSKDGVVFTDDSKNLILKIASKISEIAKLNADEVINDKLWSIEYKTLKKLVIDWCNNELEDNRFSQLSDTIIQDSFKKSNPKLKKHLDRVYSKTLWQLRFEKVNKAVEIVLENSCRTMHFSDVYNELKNFRPNDDSITERYVHAVLSNHNNALIFDRGSFTHKKNITIPHDLMSDIEKWTLAKLRGKVPFISAFGPFKAFEQQCLNFQIPNEGALYSILRLLSHPLIAYPKLPYIYLNRGEINRIPISLALEKFLQDSEGPVALKVLRDYSLNKLYLKPFQFDTLKYNIPNTIRLENGGFLHTDYLDLDMNRFNDIVDYTRNLVNQEGHISINKIFTDKLISCKFIGLDSPLALYSLLQILNDNLFELISFPLVRLASNQNSNKTRGITDEVYLYIKSRNSFCSFNELHEHFIEKLGYNEGSVYNVRYKDDIYYYLSDSLIHHDVIGWNDEKQQQIESLAFIRYTESVKTGKCYGLVSEMIEHNDLPILSKGIYWTPLLLADLLTLNKQFRILGNGRNVFIPINNEFGIETFEDLIYEILKTEHEGAANLKKFAVKLQKLGIIKRNITQYMIGKSMKVQIVGNEIVLKELTANA